MSSLNDGENKRDTLPTTRLFQREPNEAILTTKGKSDSKKKCISPVESPKLDAHVKTFSNKNADELARSREQEIQDAPSKLQESAREKSSETPVSNSKQSKFSSKYSDKKVTKCFEDKSGVSPGKISAGQGTKCSDQRTGVSPGKFFPVYDQMCSDRKIGASAGKAGTPVEVVTDMLERRPVTPPPVTKPPRSPFTLKYDDWTEVTRGVSTSKVKEFSRERKNLPIFSPNPFSQLHEDSSSAQTDVPKSHTSVSSAKTSLVRPSKRVPFMSPEDCRVKYDRPSTPPRLRAIPITLPSAPSDLDSLESVQSHLAEKFLEVFDDPNLVELTDGIKYKKERPGSPTISIPSALQNSVSIELTPPRRTQAHPEITLSKGIPPEVFLQQRQPSFCSIHSSASMMNSVCADKIDIESDAEINIESDAEPISLTKKYMLLLWKMSFMIVT